MVGDNQARPDLSRGLYRPVRDVQTCNNPGQGGLGVADQEPTRVTSQRKVWRRKLVERRNRITNGLHRLVAQQGGDIAAHELVAARQKRQLDEKGKPNGRPA